MAQGPQSHSKSPCILFQLLSKTKSFLAAIKPTFVSLPKETQFRSEEIGPEDKMHYTYSQNSFYEYGAFEAFDRDGKLLYKSPMFTSLSRVSIASDESYPAYYKMLFKLHEDGKNGGVAKIVFRHNHPEILVTNSLRPFPFGTKSLFSSGDKQASLQFKAMAEELGFKNASFEMQLLYDGTSGVRSLKKKAYIIPARSTRKSGSYKISAAAEDSIGNPQYWKNMGFDLDGDSTEAN